MTQIRYCEVSNILFAEQAQSRDILIAKNFKITVLYYRQRNIMFFYHQSHNDALDDHRRITMDEYKKEYRKVEIRHCETHKDNVYNVACEKCHEVFCVKCILRPTPCTDGKTIIHFHGSFHIGQ